MKGTEKNAKDQQDAEQEKLSTEDKKADSAVNDSECSENKQDEACSESCTDEKKEKKPQEIIEEIQKENAELKDQYLRKLADFDNYRKRMIREKQDAIDFANTNLLKDLLTVLDDFDRALTSVSSTNCSTEDNPVVQGIAMINKQMRAMLESKYNLTAFGEKGDAFDHEKHEAIASNPAPVSEPVCAEVYVKGYMLKDRVIRSAKVMVHMPDGTASADSK